MTLFMQRLLSVLPRIYFRALWVRALPNVPKTGTDARGVGWDLILFDKIQEYEVMLRKFTIEPFLNVVA